MMTASNPNAQDACAEASRCSVYSDSFPALSLSPSDGRERGKSQDLQFPNEETAGVGADIADLGSSSSALQKREHHRPYEEMQLDTADRVHASYAAVVRKRKSVESLAHDALAVKKAFSSSALCLPEINPLKDSLLHLCQARPSPSPGALSLSAPISCSQLEEWMEDTQKLGVCLFFMGRNVTGLRVRAWVKAVAPEVLLSQVIFLGKSCFYVKCSEPAHKFLLLAKNASWGNNLFALVMPWEEAFDPITEFGAFCPVWVVVKDVPVFLLSHVKELLVCLGKVLYVPSFGSFVHSRTVKVCVLWDLSRDIPPYIRIPVSRNEATGKEDAIYLQIRFDPFPLACFVCNRVGHYARSCPSKPGAAALLQPGEEPCGKEEKHPMEAEPSSGASEVMQATTASSLMLKASTQPSSELSASLILQANPFEVLSLESQPINNIEEHNSNNVTRSEAAAHVRVRQSHRKKKTKKKKKVDDFNPRKTERPAVNIHVELNSDFEAPEPVDDKAQVIQECMEEGGVANWDNIEITKNLPDEKEIE